MLPFNCKLTLAVVCCLAFGDALGLTVRKREVSTKDAEWDDDLGIGGNDDEWMSSSKKSSNKTKGTEAVDDLISELGLGADSKEGSLNKTKDTGLHSNSSSNTNSLAGSKKNEEIGSKKNTTATTTNSKGSTEATKNNKTNSASNLSSGLGTKDSFNSLKDQGLNRTSSANATKSGNVPSTGVNSTKIGTNTTSESAKANSTATDNRLGGIFDKTPKNTTAQSASIPSSPNHTSAQTATNEMPRQNTTSQIPHQNAGSTQIPHAASTTPPTPHTTQTKYNGYWIPIFNFGNNLYFLTNKGYAQLVNFPAPIVYSFKPVSLQPVSKPTQAYGQPRQNEEFVATFFEDDTSFTECYTNMDMGNLFANSYFGNWVAVFKFELGWHLQTYGGFVPLDMTGEEAPVAYEFETVQYQFSSLQKFPTQTQTTPMQQATDHEGLATWSEPLVV